MDFIRITALTDIGNNIAYSSLVPVVDMAGTPTTKKANLQIVGNLILNGAGGTYFAPAARSVLAQTVTNAAQPNITSVGTLSNLVVSGNVNLGLVGNINIGGGNPGQLLATNGNGGLSWVNDPSGIYSNSNVANYLPTFTGTVGANTISSDAASGSNVQIDANGAVFTFGQGGALYWPSGDEQWVIEPNIDNEFEIKSTSNVVISTDISNANSHFTFDSDGIFTAPSNVNLLGSRLNVGPDAASAGNLLNPTLVIANTGAQYIQAAIINNDSAGSSDWSADGAGGGDDEAWTDMGFAGYTFNDANYTITEPGDGYLFVQAYANGLGGNMVLATGDHSNTADIIFATGGFLANNEFARIDHANDVFHLTRAGSGIKFADGSIQTTAAGAGGLPLANGNSIIDIATVDGNITLDSNGNVFTFGTDGNLTTPSNLVIGPNGAGGSSIYQFDAPLQVLGEGANSALIVGWTANSSGPEDVVAMAFNNPLGNGASNLVIGVGNNSTTVNYWNFDNTGALTLPGSGYIVNPVNSSLDPLNPNVSTMIFTPDSGYSSQSLVLDPTAPGHIHLRAPGANIDEPYANIFLGGEDSSFEVGYYTGSAPNVFIHSGGNTWTFSNDGTTTFPTGNITSNTSLQFTTTFANVKTVEYQTAGVWDLYVEDSITGSNTAASRLNVSFKDNLIDKPQVYIENTKESDGIALRWTFDENGNLNFPRDVAGNTDPFLTISGGASPRILSEDVSLAGPANLEITALNTIFTGASGSAIKIYADDGEIASDGNLQLWANAGSNVAEYSWTFDTDGNLTLPGNISLSTANGIIDSTSNLEIYSGTDGNNGAYLALGSGSGNIGGDISIISGEGTVTTGGNIILQGGIGNTKGGNATLQGGSGLGAGGNGGDVEIVGGFANVGGLSGNITLYSGVNQWKFDNSGNLTIPSNTVKINFANGSPAFANLVQWTTAPIANTSAGTAGQAAYDSGGNLYVCVSTNTWAKFSGTTSW